MSTSDEFRKLAKQCRCAASATAHRDTSDVLRKMSEEYEERAQRLEQSAPLSRARG